MDLFLLKFILGLIVLLFSTQKLVDLAKNVSRILRISPLIIGITIVAIGTSLPELAVSSVSIVRGDIGLALGNIIGSNIVNVLMVLPVGLLIGKLRIGTTKTQRNALILLSITGVFFLSQIFSPFKPWSGLLLIGLAIVISFMEYQFGVYGRSHEDMKQFKSVKRTKGGIHYVLSGLILVFGIIFGSILVVNSVEGISTLTGISTTILGLTLTAIATSLPELLTTIFSQEENQEKITVGNIIGSNIYNLLLIGGVISLFPYTSNIQIKEWLWLGLTTVGFVLFLHRYKGEKPPKFIGILLFLFLIAYLYSQQM